MFAPFTQFCELLFSETLFLDVTISPPQLWVGVNGAFILLNTN